MYRENTDSWYIPPPGNRQNKHKTRPMHQISVETWYIGLCYVNNFGDSTLSPDTKPGTVNDFPSAVQYFMDIINRSLCLDRKVETWYIGLCYVNNFGDSTLSPDTKPGTVNDFPSAVQYFMDIINRSLCLDRKVPMFVIY